MFVQCPEGRVWISLDSQSIHKSKKIKDHHFQGYVLPMWKVQWQGKKVLSKGLGREGEDPWGDRRSEEKGIHRSCISLKGHPREGGSWALKNE